MPPLLTTRLVLLASTGNLFLDWWHILALLNIFKILKELFVFDRLDDIWIVEFGKLEWGNGAGIFFEWFRVLLDFWVCHLKWTERGFERLVGVWCLVVESARLARVHLLLWNEVLVSLSFRWGTSRISILSSVCSSSAWRVFPASLSLRIRLNTITHRERSLKSGVLKLMIWPRCIRRMLAWVCFHVTWNISIAWIVASRCVTAPVLVLRSLKLVALNPLRLKVHHWRLVWWQGGKHLRFRLLLTASWRNLVTL